MTKILLVEDSRSQPERLAFVLENQGYDVSTAENGVEALAGLQINPQDLVISDIYMPKMDGIEFCETLKGNRALSAIAIILLTTADSISDIPHGLNVQADASLTKPYNDQVIFEYIANVIEKPASKTTNDFPQKDPLVVEIDGYR